MEWKTLEDYSYLNEFKNGSWGLWISGPRGIVGGDELGCYNRATRDDLDTVYWTIIHVLDGHYHCCLTGRVRSL